MSVSGSIASRNLLKNLMYKQAPDTAALKAVGKLLDIVYDVS